MGEKISRGANGGWLFGGVGEITYLPLSGRLDFIVALLKWGAFGLGGIMFPGSSGVVEGSGASSELLMGEGGEKTGGLW